MSIKSRNIKEKKKKPRRLKELRAKLGNDKIVAKTIGELFHKNKIICKQGYYSIATPKIEHAIACTIVKLGRNFGFAKPEDGRVDVFIPGK